MQETQVINQLLWLPLIFLSGATFPLSFLPKAAQRFSVFLPATYLVNGLQRATLSTPLRNLLTETLSLTFWAILAFFIAAKLFRWESESTIPRKAKLWAASMALPFFLLGIWENKVGQIQAQARSAYQLLDQEPPKAQSTDKP
jgi:hypothetical protein